MPFQMVTRKEWFAMEVEYDFDELPSPVLTVQIVSDTETDYCLTRGDCGETVQEMQRFQIQEDKLQDINYNFVIGGDGNVYEGRGWGRKVQKLKSWQTDISDNLVMGFIGGNVADNPPSQIILQAFHEFIVHFTDEGKLSQERPVAIKM